MTEWSGFARTVHQYITEKNLLRREDRILVALSGGRDSVALLYALHELAPAWRWELIAGHVNHNLRPSEDTMESGLCRHIAQELDIEYLEKKLDISREGNLEQTAREMRYETLETWADEKGCKAIVTGHHLDDQAETILYRLLKGSGFHGLKGIHPARNRIRRPLLNMTREDIDTYCLTHGLVFAEDHTNRDESLNRNRIRYTILPFLRKNGFPEVQQNLAKLADSAEKTHKVLESYVCEDLESLFAHHPAGYRLKVKTWKKLSPERQIFLLQEFLNRGKVIDRHIARETLCQLRNFLQEAEKGRNFEMNGSLKWVVEPESILITRGVDRGETQIWEPETNIEWTSWLKVEWEQVPVPDQWDLNPFEEYFADDLIHIKVYIQEWCPGDRIEPMGRSKHLVSDLLKDAGVPALIRPHYPVIAGNEGILWIPGVRRSKLFSVPQGAETCIKLTCRLQKEYYDSIKRKKNTDY